MAKAKAMETFEVVWNWTLCALMAAAFTAAAWAVIGMYGISVGSTDLCTESFKAATAWAFGVKR